MEKKKRKDTEGRPCEDAGGRLPCEVEVRGWSDVCTKARTPGNTDNQLKLKEAKTESPFRLQKAGWPVHTLILDFQPPEMGDDTCVVLNMFSIWYFLQHPQETKTY